MTGTLIGIGVGPGDPELLTLKAARLIAAADLVAYPANPDGFSLARSIAAAHLRPGVEELAMVMDFGLDRRSATAAYDAATPRLVEAVGQGRRVLVLCEGDPLLYGSFTYVLDRLPAEAAVEVVPGISALTACAAAAVRPIVQGDDALVCLPATLPAERLEALLTAAEACAVFKVGRHLPKVAAVLEACGLAAGAQVIVRATHPDQQVMPLDRALDRPVPYFSLVLARRSARR